MNQALPGSSLLVNRRSFRMWNAAFVVCGGFLGTPLSANAADEKAAPMAKVIVNERPLANLGINWWGEGSLLNLIGGLHPLKNLIVYEVHLGSPGDIAGIQTGDEITHVDGRPLHDIPLRELREITRYSETGKLLPVTLYNWAKQEHRTVFVKVKPYQSKSTQDTEDKWVEWNLWGVVVKIWDPAFVKMSQVDAQGRSILIRQADRKITLRQQLDGTVQLFEAELPRSPPRRTGLDRGKAPRRALPITITPARILKAGSHLLIRANGAYEVHDAQPVGSPKKE
jgi:hypothetical protein